MISSEQVNNAFIAGEENKALANISTAKRYLAEAKNLTDILEIRSMAASMQAWATARGADEAAAVALEVKLRAERKAGGYLIDQDLQPGRPPKNRDNLSLIIKPTLADLDVKPQESKRWQRIASIPEERFEEYVSNAKRATQSALLRMASEEGLRPHVSQATGEDEWYTPEYIIEKARQLMGIIDVDPASSDEANCIVKATKYYTEEDDGLTQEWHGNVWMNPPYSQPLVTKFCNLLIEKYLIGEVRQACVLVNNATETTFYQNMLNYCKAVCFIKGRVKFIDKKGEATGAPLQGQTILYFGEDCENFGLIFSELGVVLYA